MRREQYFKRNTEVAGRSFDYHATGLQLLIGRLIVVAVLVAYQVLTALSVELALVFLLTLLVVFPWLVIRSLRFNARVTSWGNVRFDFHRTYWEAVKVYILLPVGVALTLYTTAPFLSRARARFTVGGHRIGDHRFGFAAPIGPFYKAFGLAILAGIGAFFVLSSALGASIAAAFQGMVDPTAAASDPAAQAALVTGILLLYAMLFALIFVSVILYQALLRNPVFAGMSLDDGRGGTHRFVSNIHPGRFIWIVFSNALTTALSLGLALPWAQIRLARYLAAHTFAVPDGPVDDIAGRIQSEASAVGDAYTDFEGLDLGLPF